MIPKTIHYCWFGHSPLPELARKCIASWHKYLPDYEIKEWNEDNFDVNIVPYTAEAYRDGKYAFVSDYARFWVLYRYGGIYFDTDVEVIRPMGDIIERGNFMGFETDHTPSCRKADASEASVNPGLGLGVAPGLGLIKKMLDFYEGRHFVFETNMRNQITVVHIATEVLLKCGLKMVQGIQKVEDDCYIYPAEYFCPINVTTGRLHVTPNTRTIHHYAGTWTNRKFFLSELLKRILPEPLVLALMKIKAGSKNRH